MKCEFLLFLPFRGKILWDQYLLRTDSLYIKIFGAQAEDICTMSFLSEFVRVIRMPLNFYDLKNIKREGSISCGR
jgi:hypothetical protein